MDKILANKTRLIMYEQARQIAPMFGYDAAEIANYCTAISYVESTFNPAAKVKAPNTAKGLMQINNITKTEAEKQLGLPTASENQMYDSSYNAYLGVYIFCMRLKKCNGNVKYAVAAYNQGNCSAKARARAAGYVAKWENALNTMGYYNVAQNNNAGFSPARNWY